VGRGGPGRAGGASGHGRLSCRRAVSPSSTRAFDPVSAETGVGGVKDGGLGGGVVERIRTVAWLTSMGGSISQLTLPA